MMNTANRTALAALFVLGSLGAAHATSHAKSVLTAANGMTLYIFDKDKDGKSSCYDQCAVNWPPYLVQGGEKMDEDWTQVDRTDGTKQWAYEGKPVYFYKDDAAKGDMKGDGIKKIWHVIKED